MAEQALDKHIDDEVTTFSVERRVRYELNRAVKSVVLESVNSGLTVQEVADAVIQGVKGHAQDLDIEILALGVKRAQDEAGLE